jgi:hypothetical protein
MSYSEISPDEKEVLVLIARAEEIDSEFECNLVRGNKASEVDLVIDGKNYIEIGQTFGEAAKKIINRLNKKYG